MGAFGERVVISGIGQTDFSKASGRSTLELAAEASRMAITDAGLDPTDIDGTVTFTMDTNDELDLIRVLGIDELHYTARSRGGGGGSASTVQQAAVAVAAGVADQVLVYRAFNERSGRRFGQPQKGTPDPSWNLYRPFGIDTPMKVYALWFQRYMHRYGLSNADIALYSLLARRNAASNPAAWYFGQPLTLEEHQAARWIVEPVLRLYDCCQESDGGVAIVVSRADQSARHPAPVRLLAAVQAHVQGGHELFNYYQPDLTVFREAQSLGRQIWSEAGLTPADIDVALIYDQMSPSVFVQLESLGLCGPGEARDLIAGGGIDMGGKVPVNPNGGLIGEGYIHGMNLITEAVRQVRNVAANQVAGCEVALFSAGRSAIALGSS